MKNSFQSFWIGHSDVKDVYAKLSVLFHNLKWSKNSSLIINYIPVPGKFSSAKL
jgi:hypothetical protein